MKYVIVVLEGTAANPPNGKTPLELAETPELSWLARRGQVGAVTLLPPDVRLPGEAVFLTALGYDPRHYTGRGPVVAAALRVTLTPNDRAFCCPLIATDGTTILSGNVPELTDDDCLTLFGLVAERLSTYRLRFFPAPQNNGLMTLADGGDELSTTPPRRSSGKRLEECFPAGDDAERLRAVIYDSLELLAEHPINQERIDRGLPPANTIWPYGQGPRLTLTAFPLQRGQEGMVVTRNVLVQGIARAAGLTVAVPPVPGGPALATAVRAALKTGVDVLLVPVPLVGDPNVPEVVQEYIERTDREIIAPVLHALQRGDDPFRLLCLTTTSAPAAIPVPFLLYDAETERQTSLPFDERAIGDTRLMFEEGHRLADTLFRG